MDEQVIESPCPICFAEDKLRMIAHISEIPYFGEHTQVTLMCNACGWRQTDFIPAEGRKSGAWKLVIDDQEKLRTRVVRASSCTVRVEELDLAVNPGSNATGYVSNVEGVFNRFTDVIQMVLRDVQNETLQHAAAGDEEKMAEDMEAIQRLEQMLFLLENAGTPEGEPLTLEFLDPHGHSMIMHPDAEERELDEEELAELPVGPDPAVFSKDELDQ